MTTNTPETAPQNEDEQLLKQVIDATTQISQQLTVLSETFNTKLMHSAHEEKIVDQMHKELQKYKEDMYAQLVRPILLDVIEVRDSIMRIGAVYRAKPDGEQAIPNKTFSDYAYDLQDILEKNNVEIYRSEAGDDFVPIKQRTVKRLLLRISLFTVKLLSPCPADIATMDVQSPPKSRHILLRKPAENEEKVR